MNTPKEIDYLYNHPLDAKSVVIEVGAYHGDWAAAITARYGCWVYAYEPLSEFYHKAIKYECEYPRLHIINAAVGATERFAYFRVKGTMTGEFNGDGEFETVKVVPIEDVLNACGEHCSLLALNCEGGEFEILESMIAQDILPRASTIQVQFHPVVPDCERRYAAIQRALTETHVPVHHDGWTWQIWRIAA